ncbi:MAG TPA: diguanylate cyclase, partial [Solirubrobacteraceae bacterium]
AADTIYLIKAAQGTWQSGGPYDPGWWAISVCFATAAWTEPAGRAAEVRERGTIRIPIVFALLSLSILVAGTITDVSLPAVLLALGALLSILLRLVLTFRAYQAMLQRSKTEALTDPLTGIGNRRALSAVLERRLNEPQPASMILALFDLDGFKTYNDDFGHAAGDALLQRLANALTAVLAPHASVYRMGGDEFCALLPSGEQGEALSRAALAVLTEEDHGFSISASMGSACLPDETDDFHEALRLADQRMYARKHRLRRASAAQEVTSALLSALAHRDPELSHHVGNVAELAEQTARDVGCPAALVECIGLAAGLHDIGKLAIPESILRKPTALEPEEWQLMRQHTIAAERIIASSAALSEVAPLVRSCHERWDGTGYPDGLAAGEIPLGARIIAVCDSFHAMTSHRPYREAMSTEVAIAELRAGAGTQFDPSVVAAFLGRQARTEGDQAALDIAHRASA